MIRKRQIRIGKILELTVPLFALIGMSILSWNVSWYGGKRESIAAKFESHFINLSLASIDYSYPVNSPVVAVSLSDADLVSMPVVYNNGLIESSWDSYARIIKLALDRGASFVVVNWMAPGFASNEGQRLSLESFLAESDPDHRVNFAMPILITTQLDEIFKQKNRIFDSGDCFYEVNLFCSYNPSGLSGWIVTKLAGTFAQDKDEKYFSRNLPHIYPNFLVNIPDPDGVRNWSFSEFLNTQVEFPEGAVVFVGNSLSQRLEFAQNREAIQRARYSRSPTDGSSLEDGVSYHKFWAALTQMFLDNRLIAVADFSTSTVLACVSALLAVAVMIAFGRIFAFVFYLFLVFFYLVTNILFSKYLGVYIPCYTVLFWTLVALVSAGFIEMTRYAYIEERNKQAEKQILEGIQLKSNFISLISHNLNTPIAKAKGLLDLFQPSLQNSQFQFALRQATGGYTFLQLIIKSALSLISIRDDQESSRQNSISTNGREYAGKFLEVLRQSAVDLGFQLQFSADRALEEEGDSEVVFPDERILSYLIILHGFLLKQGENRTNKVFVTMSLVRDENQMISLSIAAEYLFDQESSQSEFVYAGNIAFLKRLFDSLKASYLSKFKHSSEKICFEEGVPVWKIEFSLT